MTRQEGLLWRAAMHGLLIGAWGTVGMWLLPIHPPESVLPIALWFTYLYYVLVVFMRGGVNNG